MTEESRSRETGRYGELPILRPTVEPVRPATSAYPLVRDLAPSASALTAYDRAHFLTYARLLDAERDGIDWRVGARAILSRDADTPDEVAARCWESHIARAHAIVAGVIEGPANAED